MQLIHRFVRYQERVSGVPGRFIAPVVLAGHLAAGRGPRDVLGHRLPHRPRPRPGRVHRAAHVHRGGPAGHRPRRAAARPDGRARGAQRAPPAAAPEHEPGRDRDARLRRRRAARLPARRLLARALRRGRDAVGPHAPVHDRRRRREHARPVDGHAPGLRARAPAQARAPRPPARGRRADHRPVDLPGRVRLRRAAVPAALPAGADRLRRRASRSCARARSSGAGAPSRRWRCSSSSASRWRCSSARSPGYTTPHFPLYIAEAAVVELAALAAPRAPLRFALLSGLGIGTVGLAAEWGWSHVWMPHPWPASMLVPAVVLALAAGAGRQRPRRAHEPEPRDARERARGPARDRAARRRAGGRRRARGALLPAAAHAAATARAPPSSRRPPGHGRVERRRHARSARARRATTSGSRSSPGRAGRPASCASSPRCARSGRAATSPSARCR